MRANEHIVGRLKYIMLLSMTLVVVFGGVKSQTEADLRQQLAASEAARAKAVQGQADLSVMVKQLMAKAGKDTAKTGQAAKDAATAQTDRAAAQITLESTNDTIQKAATAAASAAIVAQEQAQRFNVNSSTLIWVQVVILVGLFGGFVNSSMIASRAHKWTVQEAREAREEARRDAREAKEAIDKVETNTNSMVAILRNAAFKEGFDIGKEGKI